MDLDTLLTTVYVFVDDWYKQVAADEKSSLGNPGQLSDSEVLTLGLVGQWRVGVPWRSERGMVRYMTWHGRGWFPKMLKVSGYNYRFRQLWRWFVRLQQALAEQLSTTQDVYEGVDSVPLPAYSLAQGRKRGQRHWLWHARLGYSKAGWFWGHRWLVSVTRQGVITGWTLGSADVQDRWLLQALLSGRARGIIHLCAPPTERYVKPKRRLHVPVTPIGPALASGEKLSRAYLADASFNGEAWRRHWRQQYGAEVVSCPPSQSPQARRWSRQDRRWLAYHRQIIETVFAALTDVFNVKRLGAHSSWGQYARLAAVGAAHNLGIWLNRSLGRPDLALSTLLC
jgi:hypothetical protein